MKLDPAHKYLVVVTVEKELFRSLNKYDWSTYTYYRMMLVIIMEGLELLKAAWKSDTHGPHGMIAESAQIAACCQKMMLEIMKRHEKEAQEDAKSDTHVY